MMHLSPRHPNVVAPAPTITSTFQPSGKQGPATLFYFIYLFYYYYYFFFCWQMTFIENSEDATTKLLELINSVGPATLKNTTSGVP